jgi:hypothetical protein
LADAEKVMNTFDSAPAKSKKQQKKDNVAFPTLDEESKNDKQPFASLAASDPEPVKPQTQGGGGKKGKKRGGKAVAESLKLGFF